MVAQEEGGVNIGSLGPDGVRQRMQEIRQKLDSLEGPAFQEHLGQPSELSGQIGANAPYNPFGGGASVQPMPTPQDLKPMIQKAAAEAGLDPHLLDAMVATESGYNPGARSKVGAMGLTQLMPETARSLGVANPFDPAQSLDGGARYLAQMLNRFHGDPKLALAAYNAGPGAVEKAGGNVPPYRETENYVERVMSLYNARKAG